MSNFSRSSRRPRRRGRRREHIFIKFISTDYLEVGDMYWDFTDDLIVKMGV